MDIYKIRNEILNGKSINNMDLRVVFYARVSTDYDTQISSLENQVEFFTEYINNNKNWKYCGKYIDEGISGTSTLKRENFNRMIRDSKSNKFDLIITKNVPRFARNTLDSIYYTQQLLSNNVGVLFLNDNINTFLPDSDLRLAIMSSIAQDEVRKLSENVRFGLKKALDRGTILGGNNLYGYKKINGKLIIDADESLKVRKIYGLYLEKRYNFNELSRQLKLIGIMDRNNKEFNACTLKRILTNPKYKGYYCGNKTRKIDYKLKKRINISNNEWKVYEDLNHIEPIIDANTWNEVNKLINLKNSKKHEKLIYSNKIYCYEHKTTYTHSGKNILTCKLYKRGKKYCDSPLIKEKDLDIILSKICGKNKRTLLNKIIIKKVNNNKKKLAIYLLLTNNEKIKINYFIQ